jgi:hypothetical protein
MRRFSLANIAAAAAILIPSVAAAQNANSSVPSIADFSGTWVYPFCCGYGPPLSGPGPVVHKSVRLQAFDAEGLAIPNATRGTISWIGDYTNPTLKPAAAAAIKKKGEIEESGVTAPTPRNQCWPEGVPFIFAEMAMQMVQQRDQITIFYEHDHQVRHVRLNQLHPAQVLPSWYGDAVGYYEGDTLVIDTVGMKIGAFSMVDWYGTPYSKSLHVTEHYRLVDDDRNVKDIENRSATTNYRLAGRASAATGMAADPNYKGKVLQLQFTVDDPVVFATPWSATVIYRRSSDEWIEHVCAENAWLYPGRDAAVPIADKPDF